MKAQKQHRLRDSKDEYYTPAVLVAAIVPFVPKGSKVWCPFDTKDSEFVHALRAAGHTVVPTHIWDGQDFFVTPPPKGTTHVISNPPYTKKMQVLERLYSLKLPFAMVLGLPILNYQEIGDFFIRNPLELLVVNKKVSFNGFPSAFNNSFFCHRMLPRQLMFVAVDHANYGPNFKRSRMVRRLPISRIGSRAIMPRKQVS